MARPERKPRGRVQRASIWSHRSQRNRASTDVTLVGYGPTEHRKQYKDSYGPYLIMGLHLGNDIDLHVTFDLPDAERIYADLGKAIEAAKVARACEPDCFFCKEPP